MDYLKKYNITEKQIEELKKLLNNLNLDIDRFIYSYEDIEEIINLFLKNGINNIYEIIMINPEIFYDTFESIETRLNKYPNKIELAYLINEDVNNLSLVGLL